MQNTSLISFNLIDVGLLLVVLVSMAIGIFRGLVREVLSIATWALSVIISMKYYTEFSGYLTGITDNETLRSGIAIGIIFIACLIIGTIISHLISTLVKSTGLSGTDRLLGFIFGFLRGALVVAIIALIVNFTDFSENNMWKNSIVTKQIEPLSNWLKSFIPKHVMKKVTDNEANNVSNNEANKVGNKESSK